MAIKGVTYWLLALATAVCSGGVGWTNICFNIDALLCIASKKLTKRPNPFWSCFKKFLSHFFLTLGLWIMPTFHLMDKGFKITYCIAANNVPDNYSFCECLFFFTSEIELLLWQLFVKESQYIRIRNPLHKQSEKACMCF